MRTLIIINRTAAKARQAWPTIHAKLTDAGIDYDLYETTAKGDATTRTRKALKSGIETIVVVGGDGTLSEAAEGFFEFNRPVNILPSQINPEATLAILPAGTGDDFARGLRGQRAPLHEWIEIFIDYAVSRNELNVKVIDVLYGLCNAFRKPFICLNASTMGIGGETARRVLEQGNLMRNLSGEVRFVAAAVGALAVWRERRVKVTLDDVVMTDSLMNLAGVANALYAGGGMMLSPAARFDDGRLDVITASQLSRAAVVRELSRIHTGGHVKNPRVKISQGTVVRIETFSEEDAMPIEADGNVRGFTPVQFSVMPRALRFVVPSIG